MTSGPGDLDGGALSLEQIDDDAWGDPPADATHLVCATLALRRKPVATLTAEDLRLLIGQQIGVEVLLPCALALLSSDPLAEGHYYPGDLLASVMRLPSEYWAAHPDQAVAVRKIASAANHMDSDLQDDIDRFLSLTGQHT